MKAQAVEPEFLRVGEVAARLRCTHEVVRHPAVLDCPNAFIPVEE